MSEFQFHRIKEPQLNVRGSSNATRSYGTSVSALEDAWNCVAAAKEELKSVDNKIRSVPLSDRNERFSIAAAKEKSNQRILIPSRPAERHQDILSDEITTDDDQFKSFKSHLAINKGSKEYKENWVTSSDFNYDRDDLKTQRERIALPNKPNLSRKELFSSAKCKSGLSKIRDKVMMQKTASFGYSTSTSPDNSPPQKQKPDLTSSVRENTSENDVFYYTQPMIRKVTKINQPPAYKGFNIVKDSNQANFSNSSHVQRKLRQNLLKKSVNTATLEQTSPKLSKKPKLKSSPTKQTGKMKRKVSTNKPMTSISTRSWRAGQEAVRLALKQNKKDATITKGLIENKKESKENKKISEISVSPIKSYASTLTGSNPRNDDKVHTDNDDVSMDSDHVVNSLDREFSLSAATDDLISQQSQRSAEKVLDIANPATLSMFSEHDSLSVPAKEVLHELFEDDDIRDSGNVKPTQDRPYENNRNFLQKSPAKIKRKEKRKGKMTKNVAEDTLPKTKKRHYDQDNVKKYMEKQLAERNKRHKEARQEQQLIAQKQKKRLDELYEKQKRTLRANLKAKERNPQQTNGYPDPNNLFGYQQQQSDIDAKKNIVKLNNRIETARANLLQGTKDKREDLSVDSLSRQSDQSEDDELNMTQTIEEGHEMSSFSHLDTRYDESMTRPNISEPQPSKDVEPTRSDRIEAIHETAMALRKRLDEEARRLQEKLEERFKENSSYPPRSSATPLSRLIDSPTFTGLLPGTGNLNQQATANIRMLQKEKAALKIQAVYRGYCVRKAFARILPSRRPASQTIPNNEFKTSSNYEINYPPSDVDKLTYEYTQAGPSKRSYDITEDSLDQSENSEPEQDYKDEHEDELLSLGSLLASTLPPGIRKEQQGDRYSVINIMTRRLELLKEFENGLSPSINKDDGQVSQLIDSHHSHTEDVNHYDQDFESEQSESESVSRSNAIKSTIMASSESAEIVHSQTPSQDSPQTSSIATEYSIGDSMTDGQTQSPDQDVSARHHSQLTDEGETKTEDTLSSREGHHNDSSVLVSAYHTPVSLQESTFLDHARDPVMSSTMRNERPSVHSTSDTDSDLTPKSSHVGLPRDSCVYSPGALERKLKAELNRLQIVDDSLHHVLDIERVRDVTVAQHERAAMAHEIESRDHAHRQDLRHLTEQTQIEVQKVADEMEKARQNAAAVANSASQTLSKLNEENKKLQETQASQKIKKAEDEAERVTEEARLRMEEARKFVADTLHQTTDRHLNEVELITTKAASAAVSSAMQSALNYHREQLEKLRKESLRRLSVSTSSDVASSSAYSANGTIPRQSNASDGYTNEDFETASDESLTPSRGSKAPIMEDSDIPESIHDETLIDSPGGGHDDKHLVSEMRDSPSASIIEEDFVGSHQTSRASTPSMTLKDVRKLAALRSPHDDSFAVSLTEDELEHEFRMVLPSEAHRRHSIDNNVTIEDNVSSSDDGTDASKHGERRVSPFTDEHSFSRFTTKLVRSYIHEEEVRSKHQAALLKLREEALIEKTKVEMAWIEVQKKDLKDKKADDQMPPLIKKQRGLKMKLQASQAEIRQLREAFKTASYERRFMLFQQKEIDKIKQGTEKILKKLSKDKSGKKLLKSRDVENLSDLDIRSNASEEQSQKIPNHPSQSDSSIDHPRSKTPMSVSISSEARVRSPSTEIPEELPSVVMDNDSHDETLDHSKTLTSIQQDSVASPSPTRGESFSFTDNSETTITLNMQRLKKKSSEKYLARREAKLKQQREQFASLRRKQDDIREWKRRIEDEERKLKSDLQLALCGNAPKDRTSSVSDSNDSITAGTYHSASPHPRSPPSIGKSFSKKTSVIETVISGIQSESDSSIVENLQTLSRDDSSSSIQEEIPNQETPLSERFEYGDDSFESGGRSSTTTTRKPLQSRQQDRHHNDEQSSVSEVASDLSDIEKRVAGLQQQLTQRQRDLEKLRKKKDRESLRRKEEVLLDELQAVELAISHENSATQTPTNEPQTVNGRSPTGKLYSPKILSPKSSQSLSINDDVIPASTSLLSSHRDNNHSLVSDKNRTNVIDPRSSLAHSITEESINDEKSNGISVKDIGNDHLSGDNDHLSEDYESDFDPSTENDEKRIEELSHKSTETLSSIASLISGSPVAIPSEDIAIVTTPGNSRLDNDSDDRQPTSLDDDDVINSSSIVADKSFNKPNNTISDVSNKKPESQISNLSDIESVNLDLKPTTKQVDVNRLADDITEHIFTDLLRESLKNLADVNPNKQEQPHDYGNDRRPRTIGQSSVHLEPSIISSRSQTSVPDEVSESYIEPLPLPSQSINGAVESASKRMLGDAIQAVFDAQRKKQDALIYENNLLIDNDNKKQSAKDKPTPGSEAVDFGTMQAKPLDSALLTAKLNDLKTMHSAIDDLLGASDSDDDEDDDENKNEDLDDFFVSNDILRLPEEEDEDELLPLFGFTPDMEERQLFVPYSVEDTNDLVNHAFRYLQQHALLGHEFDTIEPPTEYLIVEQDSIEQQSCEIYRHMIFDLTRAILQDLFDYSKLKSNRIKPWLKPPRKVFTKFTRLHHMLNGIDLLQSVQDHVNRLMDLKDGRPSIDKLKQKLPLNTSKKDYVDAVLVHELREEEPDWITYDLDELRVKYQLADTILDSLVNEIVEIINDIEMKSDTS